MNRQDSDKQAEKICINQAQLVLAEKRTTLAMFRTAVTLIGLPMGVTSFLIAVSSHFDVMNVLGYLVPLLIVCVLMASMGILLMIRSVRRVAHEQKLLAKLKKEHSILAPWLF